MTTPEILARRIDAALEAAPADLLIRDVRVLDTGLGELREPADIAIVGDSIVAIGHGLQGKRVVEGRGRIAAPGFIDTHVHIESSMVVPAEFERLVLPHGTTTAIWDPHEFANVLGTDALRYALEAAAALVMTVRVNLSSCVPASAFETSGAQLEVADLLPLLAHPKALGLAEMMNFPGVVAKDPGLLAKLAAFAQHHIDGHAPLLSGRALDAYLATGIRTDHECTKLEEGREKLRKGMTVLMREGSVAKNVTALAPLLNDASWSRLAFCTDDRNPLEILEEGHIDAAMRKAIRAGAPVMATWRAASLGAAQTFGLLDRGILAPGRRADIVLADDLAGVTVSDVVVGGRLVEPVLFENRRHPPAVGHGSVRRAPVTGGDLTIPGPARKVPLIGVIPLSLLSDHLERDVRARDGVLVADRAAGILHAAVLERHGRNGNIGRGFVHGFGPLRGAIATSIGHDSHNLTVVGDEPADMARAIDELLAIQGGAVVVQDGKVLASLALPVAGLASERSAQAVAEELVPLRQAARDIGCTLDEPLIQLAFLPLPVIPHLKLTDLGLVAAGPDGLRLIPS